MSILIQTSFGDLTVDLWTQKCPNATLNFIKLCKMKHYNNSLFIEIQKNHITRVKPSQPTTIWEKVTGKKQLKYFQDEIDHELKFNQIGYLATANLGSNLNNSNFFITLTKAELSSLKGKHTVFGKVEQGFDVLRKINDAYCDSTNRPQMNIRILHTYILQDPFENLEGMDIPPSPQLPKDSARLEAIQHLEMLQKYQKEEDIEENIRKQKAKKQAVTLEMLGDLPDANVKPPQNVLFVCKLNPVTQERDLQIIFSRFGLIKSVQIVRDWKTGQSLQYGFIEFQNPTACEEAYLKMNNVLIDDRRIQVDFSQSVSKLMPKNRKLNQPPQKMIKEQENGEKKQKIVMANRKRYQAEDKYAMITSKPNYQKRQYQNQEKNQSQRLKQTIQQAKKQQKQASQNQSIKSLDSSSQSRQQRQKKSKKKDHQKKEKKQKKQKKQHKKQKKHKRSYSSQSRQRQRSREHNIKHKSEKSLKKQKKQHKKKRSYSYSD